VCRRGRLAVAYVVVVVAVVSAGWWAPSIAFAQEAGCTVTLGPEDSIQEAIDDASEGAVICLEEGEWQENLTITKSITLRGAGRQHSVIEPEQEDAPLVLIGTDDGDGAVDVVIEDMELTRQRTSSGDGIVIEGTAQATITDCKLSARGYDVLLLDEAKATVKDCVIEEEEHTSDGIELRDQSEAKIVGCYIERRRDDGIRLRDATRATILDCHIVDNPRDDIRLKDTSQATIKGCTIEGSGRDFGIGIWSGADATISGNTISGNEMGIAAVYHTGEVTITDNKLHDNLFGIAALFQTGTVDGYGNEMRDNATDLYGNLHGSLREPLVGPSETEVVFSGPDDEYPTLQHAVDALLPGGTLIVEEGSHEAGITIGKEMELQAAAGATATLTAKDEKALVVSLVGGAQTVIASLRITGGTAGVFAGHEARVTVTGCTVFENSMAGVGLSDRAEGTVRECEIYGNGMGGIMLMLSAHGEIVDNAIYDNGYGVALWEDPCVETETGKQFTGEVTGWSNTIPEPDEPDGNHLAAVCPGYLYFLLDSLYTLEVSSSEGGEAVEPGEGLFAFDEGEAVQLHAEAQDGYAFVEWTGDIEAVDDPDAAETSVHMDDDYTVTAVFEQLEHTLTVDKVGEGTVEVNGEPVSLPYRGEYAEATKVELQAIPAEGSTFYGWENHSTNATRTVKITKAVTVTATFRSVPDCITIGPHPVPQDKGCIFWLNLPDDAVSATLKIFAVDGVLLEHIELDDPGIARYPETGRWKPVDSRGRTLGTGLYLCVVEVRHEDDSVSYCQTERMVITP